MHNKIISQVVGEKRSQTYLVVPYADVIPVIQTGINIQRAYSSKYHLCGEVPVERPSGLMYREIGVA